MHTECQNHVGVCPLLKDAELHLEIGEFNRECEQPERFPARYYKKKELKLDLTNSSEDFEYLESH